MEKLNTPLTLIFSPSISSSLSRKSTPMVASTLRGNSPAQSRCVRQVFPTPESPITSTLNVLVRVSREDTLPKELENSSDDSIYSAVHTIFGGSKRAKLSKKTRCASNAFVKKPFFRRRFDRFSPKVNSCLGTSVEHFRPQVPWKHFTALSSVNKKRGERAWPFVWQHVMIGVWGRRAHQMTGRHQHGLFSPGTYTWLNLFWHVFCFAPPSFSFVKNEQNKSLP